MSKPIVRICVPYPTHGTIKKECLTSLKGIMTLKEIEPQFRLIQGSNIACQRNNGVNENLDKTQRAFQKVDFDYYLGIDSDIAFKPEQVTQLINYGFDIVSGVYRCRDSSTRYVTGYFDHGRVTIEGMCTKKETGLKRVDWTGAGFLLIKKGVFETLKYPWFRDNVMSYRDERGIPCNTWVGDDVGFCIAATQARYNVYADLDCVVEHLLDTNMVQTDRIDTITWQDIGTNTFASITDEREE